MALNLRKLASIDEITVLLKGHILGGVNVPGTHSARYLHGKTLVFNTPADTVTFVATPASAQVPLSLQEILDQITTQAAGVSAQFNRLGQLELFVTTPGPINLDLTGTANAMLGFDTAVDTAAAPFDVPGGTPPALVQVVSDHGSNSFLVITDE